MHNGLSVRMRANNVELFENFAIWVSSLRLRQKEESKGCSKHSQLGATMKHGAHLTFPTHTPAVSQPASDVLPKGYTACTPAHLTDEWENGAVAHTPRAQVCLGRVAVVTNPAGLFPWPWVFVRPRVR
jgi:hypothetical protein